MSSFKECFLFQQLGELRCQWRSTGYSITKSHKIRQSLKESPTEKMVSRKTMSTQTGTASERQM